MYFNIKVIYKNNYKNYMKKIRYNLIYSLFILRINIVINTLWSIVIININLILLYEIIRCLIRVFKKTNYCKDIR